MTAARTVPAEYRLTGSAPIKLADALIQANGKPSRRFEGVAYTGAVVQLGYYGRAIFDLEGFEIDSQHKPALRQHDPKHIAGFTDKIEVRADGVYVEGVLSATTEAGREVASLSDEGFHWQMSVGCGVPEDDDIEDVPPGRSVACNGEMHEGPLLVFRRARLKENSFVPVGADGATSAVALADGATITLKERPVPAPAPDPVAQERERIKSIKAAFPADATFALEQIEAGVSLEEARTRFSYAEAERAKTATVQAALDAKTAELEALRKAPRGVKPIPGGTGGAPPTAADGTAKDQWEALVRDEQRKGKLRAAAVASVGRDHPELHLAMLQEANPGLELDVDRKTNRLAYR